MVLYFEIVFTVLLTFSIIKSSSTMNGNKEYKVMCREASPDCNQGTVLIDSSLKAVEEQAFSEQFISGVDFSGCSELHTIGLKSFSDNKIKVIKNSEHLIKLKMIDRHAFENNKLSSIDFLANNKLTVIEDYAFANNKIQEILLPPSIKTIGVNSFKGNRLGSLDLSTLPYLDNIRIGAFAENKIEKLNLSGCTSLQNISAFAFFDNELTEVRIPPSVQLLGLKAFHNNPNLNSICYEGKLQPRGSKEAFDETAYASFLKCPPRSYQRPGFDDEFVLDPDGILDL